ncbi:hypothetical protein V6N13_068783 [Hibiscus sabdariffa]
MPVNFTQSSPIGFAPTTIEAEYPTAPTTIEVEPNSSDPVAPTAVEAKLNSPDPVAPTAIEAESNSLAFETETNSSTTHVP